MTDTQVFQSCLPTPPHTVLLKLNTTMPNITPIWRSCPQYFASWWRIYQVFSTLLSGSLSIIISSSFLCLPCFPILYIHHCHPVNHVKPVQEGQLDHPVLLAMPISISMLSSMTSVSGSPCQPPFTTMWGHVHPIHHVWFVHLSTISTCPPYLTVHHDNHVHHVQHVNNVHHVQHQGLHNHLPWQLSCVYEDKHATHSQTGCSFFYKYR